MVYNVYMRSVIYDFLNLLKFSFFGHVQVEKNGKKKTRETFTSLGSFKRGNFEHIPFTLYPSPIPQKLFTAAREVQTDFNLLVHKVSQDFKFTKKALMWY